MTTTTNNTINNTVNKGRSILASIIADLKEHGAMYTNSFFSGVAMGFILTTIVVAATLIMEYGITMSIEALAVGLITAIANSPLLSVMMAGWATYHLYTGVASFFRSL